MADAVVASAELWSGLYSEAALLMPCSYHLNGHPVHQGQPPPRINSLIVEGGLDGKGYRYSASPATTTGTLHAPALILCKAVRSFMHQYTQQELTSEPL
jgi:hypothetical protein